MRLLVEPMALEDIRQVLEVDRVSYTTPWPASAYRRELLHNSNAHYLVLRHLSASEAAAESTADIRQKPVFPFLRWPLRAEALPRPGSIVGYAGMWIMLDEAHITTIAMLEGWRGQGLGELLLISLIDSAGAVGAQRLTLEVRVSNEVAQNLYRKYGFHVAGTRPRYYSDNNEDAYIMSTGSIQDAEFRERFASLVLSLRERLSRPEMDVEAAVWGVPEARAASGEGR
ncbi:MAG: ribosomal protein S18-alanine N-acetyltransferase [Chloroflexota bacterium]